MRAEELIGSHMTPDLAEQIASIREVCAQNNSVVMMLGQDDSPYSITITTTQDGESRTVKGAKPHPNVWYVGQCRKRDRRRMVTYAYRDGDGKEWEVGATTIYPEEDGMWRNTYVRHSGGVVSVWQEVE